MNLRIGSTVFFLGGALLTGVLVTVFLATSTPAQEARPPAPEGRAQPAPMPMPLGHKGDVVLIRCDVLSAEPVVGAFEGSSSAPAKRSANCAEALSTLLKEGFMIRDIGHAYSEKTGYVVYTLLR